MDLEQIRDLPEAWPVVGRHVYGAGRVQTFVEEEIQLPTGATMKRQFAEHPGAVAIMALDDQDRVAVVHQYRHPVRMRLVEPPAGLLDVDGEDYVDAARRELAEEAQLAANDWRVLVDVATSPGGNAENIRVYLARDLSAAPRPDGFVVEDEELDMGLEWVALDDLVDLIFAGHGNSVSLICGVMALATARATGRLDDLRAADAPWEAREAGRAGRAAQQ